MLMAKKRPVPSKKLNNRGHVSLNTARLDDVNQKYEKMRVTAQKLRVANIELRKN